MTELESIDPWVAQQCIAQIVEWRSRGWEVQLNSTAEGEWYVAVGDPGYIFENRSPNVAMNRERLRYVTSPHASPVEAVLAAAQVLR